MAETNKDFWDVDIINTFGDSVLIQIPNGDTAVLTKEEYAILRKKIDEKKVSFDFDGTINDHFDGSNNPIKEEVKNFCKKLISEDFDVHIITRRHGEYNKNLGIGNEHEIVYKVAEELGIPKEKVIFTSRAWKNHTTKDIGIDIHIDDDMQDCQYINEQGVQCIAVCLDSQYNPNNKAWQEYVQELIEVNFGTN